MTCQNCGKEIPQGACVCIACGFKAPAEPPVQPPVVPGKSLGIISLILGIISVPLLCCVFFSYFPLGVPFSIAGIITGIIGIKQAKDAGVKNGLAIAGLICSITTLVVVVALFALLFIGVALLGLGLGMGY